MYAPLRSLAALTLLLACALPAPAQSSRYYVPPPGPRLMALGGHGFWPAGPARDAPSEAFVSNAMTAVQFPAYEGLDLRAGATLYGSARPWISPPPALGDAILRSGYALSGTVDFVVPLVFGPVVVEPFAGGGVNALRAGTFEENDARERSVIILQANVAPVVAFGGGLQYPLTRSVSLEVIARRSVLFVGEQRYRTAAGEEGALDAVSTYATEVLVGLSLRL